MCSAEYELRSIQLSKSYGKFVHTIFFFHFYKTTLLYNYSGTTEWKDDLRKFMLHAGLRNTPTVFLFSDTQVRIN